jgi:dihydroxyacetone kinase-like protein
MRTLLTLTDLAAMLRSGAVRVQESQEMLSRLDSATGDGDHGATMKRTADAILESIQNADDHAFQPLLESLGWSVMSVDGGSTSPLLGSFFMGMSEAASGLEEADLPSVVAMFEAGLAKLRAQTPANVGDKTMLDALVPGVEALRRAGDQGLAFPQAFAQAAESAARGAEATKDLQAKFGRARHLGARTLGHVDPGATSIALLFAGFRDALADAKG